MGLGFRHPWVYYLLGASKEQLSVWHGVETCDTLCGSTGERVYMYPLEYNTYGAGRTIAVVTTSDTTRTYVIADHLGSARVTLNESGTVTSTADYAPFGGEHTTTGQTPRLTYIDKERDLESGLGDYGVRKYDAEVGRFMQVDALWEQYRRHTTYNYSGNNSVRVFDAAGFDWLLYDGEGVYWYGGDVGDKSELVVAYPGVSGALGYQNAAHQQTPNRGPVPEGEFSINLRPNPNRIARSVNVDGGTGLGPSPVGGIEQIPWSVNEGGSRQSQFPAWGDRRAALRPIGITAAPTRRDFYLHDSHKGFSHGCVEVPAALMDRLIQYRADNPGESQIRVRVDYPTSTSLTSGMSAATAIRIGLFLGAVR